MADSTAGYGVINRGPPVIMNRHLGKGTRSTLSSLALLPAAWSFGRCSAVTLQACSPHWGEQGKGKWRVMIPAKAHNVHRQDMRDLHQRGAREWMDGVEPRPRASPLSASGWLAPLEPSPACPIQLACFVYLHLSRLTANHRAPASVNTATLHRLADKESRQMTGGVQGRLETVLSRGGERLQPPWLPHATEGGAEEEDGGEVAIGQLPDTGFSYSHRPPLTPTRQFYSCGPNTRGNAIDATFERKGKDDDRGRHRIPKDTVLSDRKAAQGITSVTAVTDKHHQEPFDPFCDCARADRIGQGPVSHGILKGGVGGGKERGEGRLMCNTLKEEGSPSCFFSHTSSVHRAPRRGVKLQPPAASTSEGEGMSKQHMALPCQSHACKWSTLMGHLERQKGPDPSHTSAPFGALGSIKKQFSTQGFDVTLMPFNPCRPQAAEELWCSLVTRRRKRRHRGNEAGIKTSKGAACVVHLSTSEVVFESKGVGAGGQLGGGRSWEDENVRTGSVLRCVQLRGLQV
ncbi:hypothetical protein EYF80_008503 [Liparis tanakae]|uniref:Uncharacterized protein n=1 Tax=Liparis tanakae TaxID=230148 RepID=A0A4Z2IT36_9TELE|nr:hypothetical protein EYF80_008503 [Liparis tanakae]